MKQDLATKKIDQRLKQEIERQKLNETLSGLVPKPEAEVGATKSGNCNTLKMVTEQPFGITKIGARIMSIITVRGLEVTRNLSEPSDQIIMHIDVYADHLSAISPQTTSRALRALLIRCGSKSVRVENRYIRRIYIYRRGVEAKHLHENHDNMRRRPSRTDLRGHRRTESEIDWTLRHVGRRCNAYRDGGRCISTRA